jgi:folate-binding protein YgfZ
MQLSDLAADYETLRTGEGAVWTRRDVIRVHGPEATTYLQGQITQDITTLDVGASTWSFVLQPHGKVDGFARFTRVTDDEFIVDTDGGQQQRIVERLQRFKLRTEVDIEPLDWKVLAIRGAGAEAPEPTADAVVADLNWPGLEGYDLIGPSIDVPSTARLCDDEAWDALRIEHGMPVMGAELDELTIPAEAGINDRTISFTKGCYTGQELVARIDARGGNVPRHMRGIVFEGEEHVPRGTEIVGEQASAKPFGTLTSVAYSPARQAYVGLALLRRDVLPPATGKLMWHDGPTPCRIESLPLSS